MKIKYKLFGKFVFFLSEITLQYCRGYILKKAINILQPNVHPLAVENDIKTNRKLLTFRSFGSVLFVQEYKNIWLHVRVILTICIYSLLMFYRPLKTNWMDQRYYKVFRLHYNFHRKIVFSIFYFKYYYN